MSVLEDATKKLVELGSENAVGLCSIGAGVCTVLATVSAIEGGKEAQKLIDEHQPNSKAEELKLTWPCYVKTMIFTTLSIGLDAGAYFTGKKKYVAAVGALAAEKKLSEEYKRLTKETVGEEQEKDIQKRAEQNVRSQVTSDMYGFDQRFVHRIGNGTTLFREPYSRELLVGSAGDIWNACHYANYKMSLNTSDYQYWSLRQILEGWNINLMNDDEFFDIGWNLNETGPIGVDLKNTSVIQPQDSSEPIPVIDIVWSPKPIKDYDMFVYD